MKRLLPFIVLLLFTIQSYATHVIGGNINVVHVSGNDFEVTLQMFRDCDPSSSDFDNSVTIAVYEQGSNSLLSTFNMTLDTRTIIPLGDECYTPTGLCVEEGIYQDVVTLADNPNGIYLAWERCCRNSGITNIIDPLNAGMTFVVDCPDPSIGNSSPVWGSYPTDGYFCVDLDNIIDLDITDPDGDQLVYSLVDPYDNQGGINPGTATPKPYPSVTWQAPYNLNNIVGGTPPMSIDPNTGIITARPDVLGIFVFAVQIDEYRNGVIIGSTRRELQYQALNCTVDLPPAIVTPHDTAHWELYPGEQVCFTVQATDQNQGDTIYLEANSEALTLTDSPAQFKDTLDVTTVTSQFCWSPTCEHIRDDEPYKVTFTSFSLGCSGSDTARVEIDVTVKSFVEGVIDKAPNIFSPNGDGVNDFFHLQAIYDPCFDEFHVDIFDRWGVHVYESNDVFFTWDGKDKRGNALSDGTYYYVMTATFRQDSYERASHITLVR